jgi:hypothetical protein
MCTTPVGMTKEQSELEVGGVLYENYSCEPSSRQLQIYLGKSYLHKGINITSY